MELMDQNLLIKGRGQTDGGEFTMIVILKLFPVI